MRFLSQPPSAKLISRQCYPPHSSYGYCLPFRLLCSYRHWFSLQHHDQHLTGGYCEYSAGAQHGQVLEGSARDLRHPQARGPAYEERRVPQASTDR